MLLKIIKKAGVFLIFDSHLRKDSLPWQSTKGNANLFSTQWVIDQHSPTPFRLLLAGWMMGIGNGIGGTLCSEAYLLGSLDFGHHNLTKLGKEKQG